MNKDITFRRIHGRIVPIKKKDQSSYAKATGLVGAGLAVENLSGKAAAYATVQAAHFENTARGFAKQYFANRKITEKGGQMAFDFSKSASANAIRSSIFSMRAMKAKKLFKAVGIGLGGTLTTLGLLEGYKAYTKKEADTKTVLKAGTAASAISAFGSFFVHKSYFKALGAKTNSVAHALMSSWKWFK